MVSTNTRPDISELQLSLALLLYDGFTGAHELIGNISVSLVNEMLASPLHEAPGSPPTAGQKTPQETFRKTPEATFLFFGLSPGAYVLQVRSNDASPDQTPISIWPTILSRSPIQHNPRPIAPSAAPPHYNRAQLILFRPVRHSFGERCSQMERLSPRQECKG